MASEGTKKAFAELRRKGVYARMNLMCCQTCGCAAIDDYNDKHPGKYWGYAFWHNQDEEGRKVDGKVHLAYGDMDDEGDRAAEVGRLIVETLNKHGIETEWNGDDGKRILATDDPGIEEANKRREQERQERMERRRKNREEQKERDRLAGLEPHERRLEAIA